MAHFDTTGLEDFAAELVTQGIDVVRVGYADLIGTERGRDILVNRFARTVGDGVAFCRSVYGTTPMGDVVDIEGGLEAGLPDVLAFPDVSTVQLVPWEKGVAHVIADVFNPGRLAFPGESAHGAEAGDRAVRRSRHATNGRPGT
jgi:glutamine synthetase